VGGVIIEIIGWSAAVLILLSYILLSLGRIAADSISYQGLNIVGAAGFILNSGVNGAIPSAALNVIWLAIGLFALHRILRRRRGAAPPGTSLPSD
jgi:hypothetical protein